MSCGSSRHFQLSGPSRRRCQPSSAVDLVSFYRTILGPRRPSPMLPPLPMRIHTRRRCISTESVMSVLAWCPCFFSRIPHGNRGVVSAGFAELTSFSVFTLAGGACRMPDFQHPEFDVFMRFAQSCYRRASPDVHPQGDSRHAECKELHPMGALLLWIDGQRFWR